MAHGTPGSPEDLERFVMSIRHGRPLPPDQMAELERRYRVIGGLSPLAEITSAQVASLAAELDRRFPGRFRVACGAKHLSPSIEEAVAALASDGVDGIMGLVMAPHYATLSVAEYARRAQSAAPPGLPVDVIDSWHLEAGFIEAVTRRVEAAVAEVAHETGEATPFVVFTAHSIPQRFVDDGDPYPEQVADSASAVAALLGLADDSYQVAWQSAGMTGEPWLGPDLREVVSSLAGSRSKAVVVCPIGFVSDHLEVLYDIDVDAAEVASRAGVALRRTASLNADPDFIDVLGRLVARRAGFGEWR